MKTVVMDGELDLDQGDLKSDLALGTNRTSEEDDSLLGPNFSLL